MLVTAGILLAAGPSTRLKIPKPLALLAGRPLLLRALDPLLRSRLHRVILVLGHCREEISAILPSHLKLSIVVNERFLEGMGSSIVAGMRTLPDNCDAVMILLGDQPFLTAGLIDLLIDEAARRPEGIVAPTCNGTRGHPVLFQKRYFPDLLALRGDRGGRAILEAHPDDVAGIAVTTDGILVDIDTPADLEAADRQEAGSAATDRRSGVPIPTGMSGNRPEDRRSKDAAERAWREPR